MSTKEEDEMFFGIAIDALREIIEVVAPVNPDPEQARAMYHDPENCTLTDTEKALVRVWDIAVSTGFFG